MTSMKKFIFMGIISMLPLWAIWFDVCIDPGHCGAADGGSPGANGTAEPNESDFNLDMALVCYDDLIYNYGYSVLLTRHTENYIPKLDPGQKAEIANGERANDYNEKTDYPVGKAVSIHCNDAVPSAHGTETYVRRALDYPLAYLVHYKAYNYLQMFPYAHDRGIKWATMWFLKYCKMPACMIEVAFCTHDPYPNGQWYQLRDNQGGIKDFAAYGIDEGITGLWRLRPPVTYLRLPWESGRGLTLMWHPTTAPTATYSIYRREHPNPDFSLIHSGETDTVYTDNSVTSGTTYSYYVQAVSGTQTSAPSNVLSVHTPPFYSDYSLATGYNNGKKIIFDNDGILDLVYTADTSVWFTRSTDYGTTWVPSHRLESGVCPSIALDAADNPHIIDAGFAGIPDTASGEDTSFVIFYSQHLTDSVWKNPSLYTSPDSILSVSFAIDPLDTGWVVFNTFDDEQTNYLRIGKFYTQETPQGLEGVTMLDTYSRDGKSAIGVRSSDRSLHIVYEKPDGVYYLKRDNAGNWSVPYRIWIGHNPSLSVAGDLIHVIWERWYNTIPTYTKIQTCYTKGLSWSRVQDITGAISGRECHPFIEKGAVAVWSQYIDSGPVSYWEVYTSQRTLSGSWTTPQNISQSTVNSKFPQTALCQTLFQTHRTYCWTEGSGSPYSVKTCLLSSTPRSDLQTYSIPLYAFDLGDTRPSIFNKRRQGYIVYGMGFEKSVDYDSSCIRYVISGLDSTKIYRVGLVFYQDEDDSIWRQGVEIDSELVQVVDLRRRKVLFTKIALSPNTYRDGRISIDIRSQVAPKAVLSALAVWEFRGEKIKSLVHESSHNDSEKFAMSINSNPVKGRLQVIYDLMRSSRVNFKVYSANGQLIWEETTGSKPAGEHLAVWDGKDKKGNDAANGVYFIRLESEYGENSTKIILLR